MLKNGTAHTIRFQRFYPDGVGEYSLVKNSDREKNAGSYSIEHPFALPLEDGTLSFVYIIRDVYGEEVEAEEYLGATGHSVLISPSGDYIHAHAQLTVLGYPEFRVHYPLREDFYRAFTQFQINGRVILVEFDWEKH